MVASKGDKHHLVQQRLQDQAKLLELVSAGADPVKVISEMGKKSDTLKTWMKTPKFAAALERALAEGAEARGPELEDARKIDFESFSKNFLNISLFPHQLDWIDVLEGREPRWLHESMTYDAGNPNRLLVNVPPEHAKSTTVTINYATYRIATNPNVKIIIVSKTREKAREFVYGIKERLSHPRYEKLQAVYGPDGGWKEDAATWKVDTVYLGQGSRDSEAKDPTLQALGVGGQIYGARADLIILDDIVTTENAHEWQKQLNWLQKMVITRLGKNGKLLIMGTRVAPNDLYREIRNPDHWSHGKSPFTYLAMPAVLEFADKPEDWVTLWPESDRPWEGDEDLPPNERGLWSKWDGRQLYQRRGEVGPGTWAMVYQQQDVQEDSIFPPAAVVGSINAGRRAGTTKIVQPGMRVVMGIDPAMVGATAAVVVAVDMETSQRYILDVHNMTDPTPQKIRDLISEWVQKYRPHELRVEKNAFQTYLTRDEGLVTFLANMGVPLREHFTGNNKWDTGFGVAAMSALFGTVKDGEHQKDNLIELPSTTASEGVKALVNQLITWKPDAPKRQATDTVMALWFCELRIREWLQQSSFNVSHLSNRFSSRYRRGQQAVVNLDEEYASQFQPMVI
jgi:hypothetical protein